MCPVRGAQGTPSRTPRPSDGRPLLLVRIKRTVKPCSQPRPSWSTDFLPRPGDPPYGHPAASTQRAERRHTDCRDTGADHEVIGVPARRRCFCGVRALSQGSRSITGGASLSDAHQTRPVVDHLLRDTAQDQPPLPLRTNIRSRSGPLVVLAVDQGTCQAFVPSSHHRYA